MGPISTFALVMTLLGEIAEKGPKVRAAIEAWSAGQELTQDQIDAVQAELRGDRDKVAEIYRRAGV